MWCARNWNLDVRDVLRRVVPLGDDGNHEAIARLYFLNVAGHARQRRPAGCDRHDGSARFDERNRTMLHLARGIPFRVLIGDLLELEGAFEGHRVLKTTAEIQEVLL